MKNKFFIFFLFLFFIIPFINSYSNPLGSVYSQVGTYYNMNSSDSPNLLYPSSTFSYQNALTGQDVIFLQGGFLGDYVYLNSSAYFTKTGFNSLNPVPAYRDFSVNFWYKPIKCENYESLIFLNDNEEVPKFSISCPSSMQIFADIYAGAERQYLYGGYLNNNSWNMITVIRDVEGSDSTLKIYINNNLTASQTFTDEIINFNFTKITISYPSNDNIEGWFDELYISGTYALTENEIEYLYNDGFGVNWDRIKMFQFDDIISNFSLYYNEFQEVNIGSSFYNDNWYDIALIVNETSKNGTKIPIITGVGVDNNFYNLSLNTDGVMNLSSYYSNYTDDIDVFICSKDEYKGIDVFCPLLYFPSTCNISGFYDSPSARTCQNVSIDFLISGTEIPEVSIKNPFSLYYYIEDFDSQIFPLSNYFSNYESIEVKFIDSKKSLFSNITLSCNTGGNITYNSNGVYNVSLECGEFNAWLYITSNNISQNSTFYIKASNSLNSVSQSFIIVTGNINEVETGLKKLRFKDLKYLFIDIENDTLSLFVGLIFVIAMIIIGIIFIGVPLKFSGFSIVIIALIGLFSLFLMAWVGYLTWGFFIPPLIALILLIIIKFMIGGK